MLDYRNFLSTLVVLSCKQLTTPIYKNGEKTEMTSDKSTTMTIRVSKEIKAQIDEIAKAEDRSSNYIINRILKEYFSEKEKSQTE